MKESYEPSPDFVERVMRGVRKYEDAKTLLLVRWLTRLAAGGAFLGALRAAPVF
jgi:hypothetical protein